MKINIEKNTDSGSRRLGFESCPKISYGLTRMSRYRDIVSTMEYAT